MIDYHMPDAEYRKLYDTHLSVSNWKKWMRCGAAQYELDCETWREPEREAKSDPLLIGTFAHTALLEPLRLGQFFVVHPELLKKAGKDAGGMYEAYQQAAGIVKKLLTQENWPSFEGSHEVSVTGEIDGVLWCGRVDILQLEQRRFWDFKTTADFSDHWEKIGEQNVKLPWYSDYWVQVAVYGELLQQNLPGETPWIGGIVGGTKQDPPAIGAWEMSNGSKLYEALEKVKQTQRDVIDWRNKVDGKYPTACGDFKTCQYCREHSSLNIQQAV